MEAAHEAVAVAAQQAAAAAAAAAAGGSPAVVAAALSEMAAALKHAESLAVQQDISNAAAAVRTEQRTKHVEAMLTRATTALEEEVRMSGQSFTEILEQLRHARERASSDDEGDSAVSEVLRRAQRDDSAAAAAGASRDRGIGDRGPGGGRGIGIGDDGAESLGGSSSGLYDLSPMSERNPIAAAAARGYRAEQRGRSSGGSSRQHTPNASDGGIGVDERMKGPVPSASPERGKGEAGGRGRRSGDGSREYGIHVAYGGASRASEQPFGRYQERGATTRDSIDSIVPATTDGGIGTVEVVGPAELIVDAFGTLTKM